MPRCPSFPPHTACHRRHQPRCTPASHTLSHHACSPPLPRQEPSPDEVLRAAAVAAGTSHEISHEISHETSRGAPGHRQLMGGTSCVPTSGTASCAPRDAPYASPAADSGAVAWPRCYLYRVPAAATLQFAPNYNSLTSSLNRLDAREVHRLHLNRSVAPTSRAYTHSYVCTPLPPRAIPSHSLSSAAAVGPVLPPPKVRLLSPQHPAVMCVRPSPSFYGLVYRCE